MNLQQVYKVKVFDKAPPHGPPRCVVTMYFSEAALKIIKSRGETPNESASRYAKSLAYDPGIRDPSATEITHETIDLDLLYQDPVYPDDTGSKAWVQRGESA